MQTPFVVDCIKEPEKQKPPKHQAANFPETRFGTFPFRASAIARQGTVASPARLPGSEFIRAAPDADASI